MRRGLIIGEFLPLHNGHTALINFALRHCNELVVLIIINKYQPISGSIRYQWLKEIFTDKRILIEYSDDGLSDLKTSLKEWSEYLLNRFPDIDILFTSGDYGNNLARHMNIEHIYFDRKQFDISSKDIIKNPYYYWSFIPDSVRPYFVKKVCIYGQENQEKIDLTLKLAKHFNTDYVHKMINDILGERDIIYDDILQIAQAYASEILKKQKTANRILFCDTDYITAKIFSRHYFNRSPEFPDWVEESNNFDLYLFYEFDTSKAVNSNNHTFNYIHEHKEWFFSEIEKAGINYCLINGSPDDRFIKSCNAVKNLLSV